MAMPMRLHGQISVTLTFYYRARHAFAPSEVRIASALANVAAAALGTSDLYENQKALRARAESAERRAAFVAAAGAELSLTLDCPKILTSLANLVVPFFADWCTVDMV